MHFFPFIGGCFIGRFSVFAPAVFSLSISSTSLEFLRGTRTIFLSFSFSRVSFRLSDLTNAFFSNLLA